jgi:acetyl esterase/lipase
MVVVLVQYRFLESVGTEAPIPCIQDVKSAMRWVRSHAEELGIDRHRIAAGGVSAGGYLAAAAAMINGFDDPSDDLTISPKPDALVLTSAVVDNGPGQFGFARMANRYQQLSPAYNVTAAAPPTIGFFGGADRLASAAVLNRFAGNMAKAGVRFDLHVYPGQSHTFDAFAWNNPYFYETLRQTDEFFVSLGWLSGSSTVAMPAQQPNDSWQAVSTVSLNANATPEAVQALMQNVVLKTFNNASAPLRTITWQLDDGVDGASNVAVSHVRIVPVGTPEESPPSTDPPASEPEPTPPEVVPSEDPVAETPASAPVPTIPEPAPSDPPPTSAVEVVNDVPVATPAESPAPSEEPIAVPAANTPPIATPAHHAPQRILARPRLLVPSAVAPEAADDDPSIGSPVVVSHPAIVFIAPTAPSIVADAIDDNNLDVPPAAVITPQPTAALDRVFTGAHLLARFWWDDFELPGSKRRW